MEPEVVLEVREVSKSFPGVKALDRVSLQLRRHEILGLVGENGAGKSTLLKILSGVYWPDGGHILRNGKEIRIRSVKEAGEYGIAMVFQEQSLLPNLSVRENIFLGNEGGFIRYGVINWKKMTQEAARHLAKVGSTVSPEAYTADLSFAERQMIEIAKAMSLEERVHEEPVIFLDEPTSVLQQEEVDQLFDNLRNLKQRASIVFISHRLDEVLAITDRIYVLKDGCNVATLDTGATDISEVQCLMVGRDLQEEYYREGEQTDYHPSVVMEVRNLSRYGAYHDVSFDLHQGEILGIVGVVGSGREELCRSLFGAGVTDSGTIKIRGEETRLASPTRAISKGIGYVPMERRTEGLVLYLGVAPNITLANLDPVFRMGFLDYREEANLARSWIQKLRIKTPSHRTLCLNLSGGNQQKVVLSKWLASNVSVLILDHPTRGLDVGAKEEVYELVRRLAQQGLSMILVGDTLEEVIGLSNTILAMKDGQVTQRFDAPRGGKPMPLDIIQHIM